MDYPHCLKKDIVLDDKRVFEMMMELAWVLNHVNNKDFPNVDLK
jgi:hypothetical protein